MTKVILFSLILITSATAFGAQQDTSETGAMAIEGREAIHLDTFKCESNTGSSFLNRVCYDKESQTVIVALNDTYQRLCGVPSHIIGNWLQAKSMGRYYFNRIKGHFSC